jgi:hypothetical protein
MYIVTAKGCAWRAFYVYSGTKTNPGPQRLCLGIDPTARRWRNGTFREAELFGAIGYRRDCTGGRKSTWSFRFGLPRSRHWWRLDGRRKQA